MKDKELLLQYATLVGFSKGMIQGIQTGDTLTNEQKKMLDNNLKDLQIKEDWFNEYVENLLK